MTEPTITCEEALRRLAAYLDGELDDGGRFDVTRHLDACKSCMSRAEFERQLKARLAGLRRGDVSAAFEERIREVIRRGEGGTEPWS
jgi:anti-sigma factor (TIGR02949 family)